MPGALLLRTTARKAASRLSGAQIASMRWSVSARLSGSAVAVTASTSCASGRGASLRPGMGKANSSWQGGRNGVMRRSDLLTLSFNPFRGPFGPSADAPQGTARGVPTPPPPLIAAPASAVVQHGDPRPVKHSVSQSDLGGIAHDDDAALATALGYGCHAREVLRAA